jgi:hypothetical protein
MKMGWYDLLAGDRYLQWKRDLINGGFTVSHQLVCGEHSVLFDDIRRVIAFVSPQLCHCWNYRDVRNVGYKPRAQFYNKVRYELNMMTSDTKRPLAQIFIETTDQSEPDYWVATILAHVNQR